MASSQESERDVDRTLSPRPPDQSDEEWIGILCGDWVYRSVRVRREPLARCSIITREQLEYLGHANSLDCLEKDEDHSDEHEGYLGFIELWYRIHLSAMSTEVEFCVVESHIYPCVLAGQGDGVDSDPENDLLFFGKSKQTEGTSTWPTSKREDMLTTVIEEKRAGKRRAVEREAENEEIDADQEERDRQRREEERKQLDEQNKARKEQDGTSS